MVKFKVLQMPVTRLWTFPHRLSYPAADFFKSFTAYYFSFNIIAFIITSAVFVYQNSTNFIMALRTSMVCFGCSQALGMFLSVGFNIMKVKKLHLKLQEIVNETDRGKFPWNSWINLDIKEL